MISMNEWVSFFGGLLLIVLMLALTIAALIATAGMVVSGYKAVRSITKQ